MRESQRAGSRASRSRREYAPERFPRRRSPNSRPRTARPWGGCCVVRARIARASVGRPSIFPSRTLLADQSCKVDEVHEELSRRTDLQWESRRTSHLRFALPVSWCLSTREGLRDSLRCRPAHADLDFVGCLSADQQGPSAQTKPQLGHPLRPIPRRRHMPSPHLTPSARDSPVAAFQRTTLSQALQKRRRKSADIGGDLSNIDASKLREGDWPRLL